jgi:predicted ATPase
MANDVHMHAPLQSGKSLIDLFYKIASTMAPKHFHAFGCSVYVVTERMQQGGKGSKWEE